MSRRKKLLLASGVSLVILGLLVLVVLRATPARRDLGGRGAAPSVPPAPGAVPAGAGDLEAGQVPEDEAPGEAPAPALAVVPAPAGGWLITGRLVRGPGGSAAPDATEPAESVRVLLTRHPRRTRPEEAPPPREVRTDAAGRFELAGVPGSLWLRIEIDDPASAYRTLSFRLADPDAGARRDLGDILLEPAAALTVELVGPRGDRVEKARVLVGRGSSGSSGSLGQLGFHESKRDAEERGGGRYVLERAPPGENRVEVTAPGCAPARERVDLPREEPLVIQLAEGRRITGFVRAPDGSPIERAGVDVSGPELTDPSPKLATDASGAFAADFLADGSYGFIATADGWTSEGKANVPSGTEGVEITLRKEAIFAGRALAEEGGKPVPGAKVTLRGGGSFTAQAAEDGTFAVRKVPPGSYTVEADHPDFAPHRAEAPREVAEGERIEGQVIRLAKGITARGMVLDAGTREPIADATVRFSFTGAGGARREAKSGPDGSFEVRGLAEGSHRLTALSPRHLEPEPKPVEVVAVGLDDLEIALERGGSISGVILDAGGKPIGETLVRPNLALVGDFDYGSAMQKISNTSASSDAGGKFTLEGLPPHAAYAITATHGGHAPATVQGISVGRGQAVEGVEVRLPRGGTVRGRITDENGAGIAGAAVTAEAREDGQQFVFRFGQPPGATSDGEGGYILERIAPGATTIRARVEGRMEGASDGLDVGEGAVLDGIDIVLGAGVAISGRVVDAAGNGIDGVDVSVNPARVRTDAGGRFDLKGLRGSAVEVMVSKAGFARKRLQATAPADDLTVTLEPVARISGRVRSKGRDAFDGLQVVATPEKATNRWWDDTAYAREARLDGTFDVEVGKGTYVLQATATGLPRGTSGPITVEAGEEREGVVIELVAGGTIEGIVLAAATGAPVAGARVRVNEQQSDPARPNPLGGHSARTRDDGTFTLEGVPEGVVDLVATHADYAAGVVRGMPVRRGEAAEARVELSAGGTIRGTVLKAGAPVSGAQVWASPRVRDSFGAKSAVTGPQGAFEIKAVPAGEYTVTVMPPGRRVSSRQQDVTVYEGQVSEVHFAEAKGIRISGKVRAGGAPVSGGSVYAAQLAGGFNAGGDIGTGGDYSVDVPRPGTYMLMVQLQNRAGFKASVTVPEGAADVQYDIDVPLGQVSGIVVDASTGAGVPDAQVGAFASGAAEGSISALFQSLQAMVQSDGEGRFTLTGLSPGVYSIRVFSTGYAHARIDGVEVAERRPAEEVRVPLSKGVTLRARVLDASGAPVGGAMAFLRDAAGAIVPNMRQPSSGADGVLELADVAPGVYKLMVVQSSHAPSEQPVRVEPEGFPSAEPVFRLGEGGRIDVRVTARRGGPVEGAIVEALDGEGRDTLQDVAMMMRGKGLVTGSEGRLALEHLPPGEYRVSASRGESRSRAEKVTVREGEAVEARLELE